MKKELNRILSKLRLIINNSGNNNLLNDIEKEFHNDFTTLIIYDINDNVSGIHLENKKISTSVYFDTNELKIYSHRKKQYFEQFYEYEHFIKLKK